MKITYITTTQIVFISFIMTQVFVEYTIFMHSPAAMAACSALSKITLPVLCVELS